MPLAVNCSDEELWAALHLQSSQLADLTSMVQAAAVAPADTTRTAMDDAWMMRQCSRQQHTASSTSGLREDHSAGMSRSNKQTQ